ncbi:MAG: tetratricopeptide repeat protein [Myxococcota bacterium]
MKPLLSALLLGALVASSPACRSADDAREGPPHPEETSAPEEAPDLSAARAAVEAGRLKEAVVEARAAVEAQPEHLDAWLLLASAHELAGNHDEALRAADRALELDPRSVGALVTRSAALRGLERPEEAAEQAEAALKLDPDSRAALWNLARVADDPIEPLRRLAKLEPDAVEVRMTLARALAERDRLGEAAEQAEAAADRSPRDPAIRVFLAGVLYETGRFGTAMDHAQAALKLDPDRSEALEIFKAAFYVAVAAELRCRHGQGPWSEEEVEPVLATYREQGLGGTEVFHEYHERFAGRDDIRARIERAAEDCDAE